MGTLYEFNCDACGLSAGVSGGPDRGVRVHTDTRFCPSCRELCDVEVGWTHGPRVLGSADGFNLSHFTSRTRRAREYARRIPLRRAAP